MITDRRCVSSLRLVDRVLIALVFGAMLQIVATSPIATAEESEGRQPKHVLIELEHYDQRVPDDDTFAVSSREMSASNCRVLSRFFVEGYLTYRFTVPETGVYTAWLRYGSKGNVPFRVALDQDGPPELDSVKIKATGGFIGPGVWGWARLFRTRLTAGEHTLAVGSAMMRPDCIYVSADNEEPLDAVISTTFEMKLSPKVKELLDRPIVEVRPDWLRGATEYRLPKWYESHRVHAHTRLSLRWLDDDVFFNAAEGFRQMGARVFARHIKTGGEGAWWPSKLGVVDPAIGDRNVAKEIIDNAHANGCRILVYHRHMEDEAMAQQHPDWVCRDWGGRPLSTGRGDNMCFNSPYRDYLLGRALELVELGADGFYYDEAHMPKQGCWCEHCRKLFTEQTGLQHPARAEAGDPIWHKLLDFNNLTIERTFLYWRRALHAANPELVMLIGSNTWPSMADRHLTNRLFRIADSMKTEFSLPAREPSSRLIPPGPDVAPFQRDAKLALGYTLARDSTDGRPSHVWTHGLLDERSALFATAGVLAHGSIANLDVGERAIPDMMFRPAFELGEKVSPHLAGARPVRWAALHYSELARDRHVLNPHAAWEQVLYPLYGAYLALLRQRVPVGIVTDSQLAEGRLSGYKVLFLPAADSLTEEMRVAVARFEQSGGVVIRQQASWQWHSPDGQDAAIAVFLRIAGREASSLPVRVTGGPERMHAVAFTRADNRPTTIALANDFSWVYTGRRPSKKELAEMPQPPPPCRDVKVILPAEPRPKSLVEVITGRELTAVPTSGGLVVSLPDFDHMAVVAISY